MYCKYCGSRITPDTTKCVYCGANIDLNDGGQSFFDDNELNAWQSDSMAYNAQSSVPRTEMREPLPEKSNFEEEYEKTFERPQASVGTRGTRSRSRAKKKKNIMDYLNLSSSNKLIIFCIASALAIVLLVVAIIAVLNSGNDEPATESTSANYSTSATGENTVNSNANEKEPVENSNSNANKETEDNKAKENETTKDNEKSEVKGIKVLIDNKEISHPVSAYIVNEKIYVSIDRVLKAEGYNAGVKTNYNENRIRYDHAKTSKAIEIEKGTDKIWIRENDESVKTQYLDGANFNEGSDTYVAATSFFNKIGYSKVDYDKETMTLTVGK